MACYLRRCFLSDNPNAQAFKGLSLNTVAEGNKSIDISYIVPQVDSPSQLVSSHQVQYGSAFICCYWRNDVQYLPPFTNPELACCR